MNSNLGRISLDMSLHNTLRNAHHERKKGNLLYVSYVSWKKEAQSEMSAVSRHMSYANWTMWLNVLPPGMVWQTPGCTPKGVHPGVPSITEAWPAFSGPSRHLCFWNRTVLAVCTGFLKIDWKNYVCTSVDEKDWIEVIMSKSEWKRELPSWILKEEGWQRMGEEEFNKREKFINRKWM